MTAPKVAAAEFDTSEVQLIREMLAASSVKVKFAKVAASLVDKFDALAKSLADEPKA